MTLSLPQVTQSTTGSVSVYNFKSTRLFRLNTAIRVRVVEELHQFTQSIFCLDTQCCLQTARPRPHHKECESYY